MSYQSMLQQAEEDHQHWGSGNTGNGVWGSCKAASTDERGFSVDGRNGGEAPAYRGGFVDPLMVSSGFGTDFTSDLFRQPVQQNSLSAPFSWQSLLSGQANARWQPDNTSFPGFATEPRVDHAKSLNVFALGEENVRRDGENDSTSGEGGPVKEEWTNNVKSDKENWRKSGDFMIGDVKLEESENIYEAGQILGHEVKSRKRYRSNKLEGHPELTVNINPSGSTSLSDSDSDDSEKLCKKDVQSRKALKRPGQDADGNVTWTDESVRFLFETYDAIHQRLWEESKGQVKYQKKWTPILKAMQAKFGNHFTKKQCQSKYWSVRRECTEYRITSAKAAATDPLWNPSIAGRELLKPKFYDVWLDVSGKNQVITTKTKISNVKGEGASGELLKGEPSPSRDKDGQPMKQRVKDSNSAMKEMQRLMLVQLQASEKREEAMKYRAELMMELLTRHIEHVENRVSIIDESRTPQTSLLERVNLKLEKVLEGFTMLNQNLSMLS